MHVKSVCSRTYFQVLTKDQPRRKRVDAWRDKMMEQKDMSLPLTMKTPKSQLTTEQQSTKKKKKKKPKPTKKDTWHLKTKRKPNETEGKLWASDNSPQPGGLAMEGGASKNLALKGSRIWSQEFHRTRGNRNSTLGGNTQGLIHISTLGKKQWSHKRLGQTYLLVLRVSCRGGKWLWLTVGIKTLAVIVLGVLIGVNPPWGHHFLSDLVPHNSL